MSSHLAAGQNLDGYMLLRFLGRGGFGEVWLCRSEAMGVYHALKFVAGADADLAKKEHGALALYRREAALLRSPHLMPIEHINRSDAGLYYVMPLADGVSTADPSAPEWQPLSLATLIEARATAPTWFSSAEILSLILPILHALQTLSDAGLVHRDVKPENIMFLKGNPCLGDISLLGEDSLQITRRGTPGYATPTWYADGLPDMYGAAATLYTLLTGHHPDKMGRAAFLWPPQGEASLSDAEILEWRRLHNVIRRATEEKVSERFMDFVSMARQLSGDAQDRPASSRLLYCGLAVLVATVGVGVATFQSRSTDANPPIVTSAPVSVDAAPKSTDQERADYLALEAMIEAYFEDGQYAKALDSVEQLLSRYPEAQSRPAYSIARAAALIGLGRTDEAREELGKDIHLSPDILPMIARKDLWEQLGDLGAAENDLTRILEAFGPDSAPLFYRADIHAQRGNFAGVHADKMAAIGAMPDNIEQRRLVEAMWTTLETNYPGYRDYLESLPPGSAGTPSGQIPPAAELAHDNAWILEVGELITHDITHPVPPKSQGAMDARKKLSAMILDFFEKEEYGECLSLLDEVIYSTPSLLNTPVLSLFRALLLGRLGHHEEADAELVRPCHDSENPRLIDARACLLNALDRRQEAETLLTRMLEALPPDQDPDRLLAVRLLKLRARIRALLGDYQGVRDDRLAALAAASTAQGQAGDHASGETLSAYIEEAWGFLESSYPGYAAYLSTLPER